MPKPGSTTQRDYGARHQRIRKALLHTAVGSTCTRCGQPITSTRDAHLDHTDDRLGYAGWAHAKCNLSAGAAKGNRERGGRADLRPSEDW